MKKSKFTMLLMVLLFIPATLMYVLDFLLFHDAQYLMKDFLSQLAFLPVFYFFSSIIIDSILAKREKEKIMKNIYTLIGVFFSEFGNEFIQLCGSFDTKYKDYHEIFRITAGWGDAEYATAMKRAAAFEYKVNMDQGDLQLFRNFLLGNRHCLITVLENNNLVEHDSFTDLLLAIFHLCEEFKYRNIDHMSDVDREHLAVDTVRAYSLIGIEWLKYSKYLKQEYPHLYSLSISYNPFCFRK